jgi:hypothetical protein
MNDMAGLGDDARGSLKPLLLGIALMATAGGCSEDDRPEPEKRLGKPQVMRIVTPGAAGGGRTLVEALATTDCRSSWAGTSSSWAA